MPSIVEIEELFDTECYNVTFTIKCESGNLSYTVDGYSLLKETAKTLLINAPIDPANSECINQIDWQISLNWEDPYWILSDFNSLPIMQIEGASDTYPTNSFSEWTIIGDFFADFQIDKVDCPSSSCDCSLIFATNKYIYYGLEVGVFNGKSQYVLYLVGVEEDALSLYWNEEYDRWEINLLGSQYQYPIPDPLFYLEGGDCPNGIYTTPIVSEGPLIVSEGPLNATVYLTNCNGVNDNYSPAPLDEYCCSLISFLNEENDLVQFSLTLSLETWPDLGALPTYSFDFATTQYAIRFNGTNQSWELWVISQGELILIGFTTPGLIGDGCPQSIFSDWIMSGSLFIDKINEATSFTISVCESDLEDIPEIIQPEEDCSPYEICRNKNLLSKSAIALSKDIASISKREVFGFKCDDAWENIFMRSLIIDALNCSPYGVYSEEEEQCLIGKLTDKCNC
jgi:hypothetical protein